METKIIEYGTQRNVQVLSVSKTLLVVKDEKGEAYLLFAHGIKELPNEGDEGTITFVKSSKPRSNGCWNFEAQQNTPV